MEIGFTLAGFIVVALPMLAAGLILRGYQKADDLKGRKNPITRDLLRAPATHARENFDRITDDLYSQMLTLFMVPGICLATLYGILLDRGELSLFVISFVTVFGIGGWAYSLAKLLRSWKERRHWALGIDAELAVAQELDLLMLDGYRVFHDFPADGFNIDHVVIGKNGVFAIETKGRTKPVGEDGKSTWKVQYDGKALQFPQRKETSPLEQANRQADWLTSWLTSAVGEQVKARPILMLPGWYIERTSSNGMPVLNGRNSQKIFPKLSDGVLSVKHVQQVAHQIEQRCRNVKPIAYAKDETNK